MESGIGTRPGQSYLPLPEQSATMPACAGPADRSGKGMAATMTDKQVPGGQGPPSGVDRRQDRLRRALRENLKRRKAQARGRNEETARPGECPGAIRKDSTHE